MDDIIFALDVGTRSIKGVVGLMEDGFFRVIAADVREHGSRAMFDGQIHDIGEVARGVSAVKSKLEENSGRALESVYIAAAGRALKTIKTGASRRIPQDCVIDGQLLRSIEIEALLNARDAAEAENAANNDVFDLVGYSPAGMYLDGYPMTTLQGHRGSEIRIEYLTTFLPRSVVESLYMVMRQAGLVVAGITLEPIAALGALVSGENRRLNLALADIGAGTSDIAITSNGSVFSYSMVPFAGDKVTEIICDRYLTDFNTGESIKRQLYDNTDYINYFDIFNKKNAVSYADICETVFPVVDEIVKRISDAILSANRKPPSAVIVVGGGCRLPEFEARLAGALGIHRDRVAVQDRASVIGLKCDFDALDGPDSVTAFGIAIYGSGTGGGQAGPTAVSLNNKPVRLSSLRNHTVSEVLISGAYTLLQPTENPGKPLSFYVNGEKRTVCGQSGRPTAILVNGSEASLDASVQIGDKITVTEAAEGRDAQVFISDFIQEAEAGSVTYEGVKYFLTPRAALNGEDCPIGAEVKEGDRIDFTARTTLKMFTDEYAPYETGTDYYVNGVPADMEYVLHSGDEITIRRVADKFEINGEIIEIEPKTNELLLLDALDRIRIDGADRQGWLALQINGAHAKLTDRIFAGDKLGIKWEND